MFAFVPGKKKVTARIGSTLCKMYAAIFSIFDNFNVNYCGAAEHTNEYGIWHGNDL